MHDVEHAAELPPAWALLTRRMPPRPRANSLCQPSSRWEGGWSSRSSRRCCCCCCCCCCCMRRLDHTLNHSHMQGETGCEVGRDGMGGEGGVAGRCRGQGSGVQGPTLCETYCGALPPAAAVASAAAVSTAGGDSSKAVHTQEHRKNKSKMNKQARHIRQ